MIRTPIEYRESQRRLKQTREMLRLERKKLGDEGLSPPQVRRVLQPTEAFVAQIVAEVRQYEALRKGEFSALRNLDGIGQLLVALRIAQGLTQRELARRLDVHETQVSRDERSDYYGSTVERINRVLEALGVELATTVKYLPPAIRKSA